MDQETYEQWKERYNAELAEAKKDFEKRNPGVDVYTTDEATEAYDLQAFLAPIALVKRRLDGVRGTLEFQDSPRLYFHFVEG